MGGFKGDAMREKLEQKADRLCRECRVCPNQNGWYQVLGDTKPHDVCVSMSHISCSCSFFANQGVVRGRLCSHIYAVISYMITKRNKKEDVKV